MAAKTGKKEKTPPKPVSRKEALEAIRNRRTQEEEGGEQKSIGTKNKNKKEKPMKKRYGGSVKKMARGGKVKKMARGGIVKGPYS
mgnify:CR=1 FL=1|tara:strand:- start:5950 stop:6204 length:255 start_codon:yes stop_codon:yes gene_type:complete